MCMCMRVYIYIPFSPENFFTLDFYDIMTADLSWPKKATSIFLDVYHE